MTRQPTCGCGHAEDEHEPPREGRERPDGSPESWHCKSCCVFGDDTEDERCLHPFQPAAEEPVDAS